MICTDLSSAAYTPNFSCSGLATRNGLTIQTRWSSIRRSTDTWNSANLGGPREMPGTHPAAPGTAGGTCETGSHTTQANPHMYLLCTVSGFLCGQGSRHGRGSLGSRIIKSAPTPCGWGREVQKTTVLHFWNSSCVEM